MNRAALAIYFLSLKLVLCLHEKVNRKCRVRESTLDFFHLAQQRFNKHSSA